MVLPFKSNFIYVGLRQISLLKFCYLSVALRTIIDDIEMEAHFNCCQESVRGTGTVTPRTAVRKKTRYPTIYEIQRSGDRRCSTWRHIIVHNWHKTIPDFPTQKIRLSDNDIRRENGFQMTK